MKKPGIFIEIPVGPGFTERRQDLYNWFEKNEWTVSFTRNTIGEYVSFTRGFMLDANTKITMCLTKEELDDFTALFVDKGNAIKHTFESADKWDQWIHDMRGFMKGRQLGLI